MGRGKKEKIKPSNFDFQFSVDKEESSKLTFISAKQEETKEKDKQDFSIKSGKKIW